MLWSTLGTPVMDEVGFDEGEVFVAMPYDYILNDIYWMEDVESRVGHLHNCNFPLFGMLILSGESG